MVEHPDNFEPEEPSRSQIKREMLALQDVAQHLIAMPNVRLANLSLTPRMQEALEESHRIKGHNAMRRHVRRVGKLLRSEDTEAIQTLLQQIDNRQQDETRHFQQLEQWRDRLLKEGDAALEELLREAPGADRQQLRQMIRNAHKEQERGKPPVSSRKLFRYLRELEF